MEKMKMEARQKCSGSTVGQWVWGLVLVMVIGILASCGQTAAPFQQRDDALAAIEFSELVDSMLYARSSYDTSKNLYDEGESLIVEEGSSKKNVEAKEAYINAKVSAETAYQEAVPLYTRDIINETEALLEEAKDMKVHHASEDLYEMAVEENQNAGLLLEQSEFMAAKESTFMGREVLRTALEDTRELLKRVEAQAQVVANLHSQAMTAKAKNAVPEEYGELTGLLEMIGQRKADGYYLEVIADQDDVVSEFRSLLVLIEEKRQEALRELASAERTISELKNQNKTVDQEISRLNEQYQSDN